MCFVARYSFSLPLPHAQGPGLVHTRDKNRRTPLHYACAAGHLVIARFLLELGITEIDGLDKTEKTPLMVASIHDQHQCSEMVLLSGANADVKDCEVSGLGKGCLWCSAA